MSNKREWDDPVAEPLFTSSSTKRRKLDEDGADDADTEKEVVVVAESGSSSPRQQQAAYVPLSDAAVIAAIDSVCNADAFETFGLDLRGSRLDAAAAAALGRVNAWAIDLAKVDEASFTAEGRSALIEALGANGIVEELRLNAAFVAADVAFVADLDASRDGAKRICLLVDGEELEDEQESVEGVYCDGEDCGRLLQDEEVVYVALDDSADYCQKCSTKKNPHGLRRTTARERYESAAPSPRGDGSDDDDDDDDSDDSDDDGSSSESDSDAVKAALAAIAPADLERIGAPPTPRDQNC